MDNWFIKIKKVVRYIRHYGLARTFTKIRGIYHLRFDGTFEGDTWDNLNCKSKLDSSRFTALVGCGNFAFSNIAYYLFRHNKKFLRCAYDPDSSRALSLCRSYGGLYVTRRWEEILADESVRLVYIASNHSTHCDYAIACINAGKHVHIEKPHVVSGDQLEKLMSAMKNNPEIKVFLGFNRPRSALFDKLQHLLSSQEGPIMFNWFVAGHRIPNDHWYFDDKEGGRILGNLIHWTDMSLHLINKETAFPCRIIPGSLPSSRSDFMLMLVFADGSSGAITFSAKGATFEGVREVLNLQRGDVMAQLTDFKNLTVDINHKKYHFAPWFRDHGHEANITNSYQRVEDDMPGEDPTYVEFTARFALAIKNAIESQTETTVHFEDQYGGRS